jgi:hypothetical protein
MLKVRVSSSDSRGTYAGSEIDHYFHIDNKGRVTYLGNLKESWYEDEHLIRSEMNGFTTFLVPQN